MTILRKEVMFLSVLLIYVVRISIAQLSLAHFFNLVRLMTISRTWREMHLSRRNRKHFRSGFWSRICRFQGL